MAIYEHREKAHTQRLSVGHSIFAVLPIALMAASLVTDLAFWLTGHVTWSTFSAWMIGASIIMVALASVIDLTDLLGQHRPVDRHARLHFAGHGIAVLLALADFYLRYFAGPENAVVPGGMMLSLMVAGLLVFTQRREWRQVRPLRGTHGSARDGAQQAA